MLFLACLSGRVTSERVDVEGLQGLGETRHHVVENEDGKRYHLLVRLPDGYDDPDKPLYPTVYLLDGGALYPLLSAYYGYLRNGAEAPDLILVAVSYGTSDWRHGNARSHDYTAPSKERDFWGGASDFQAFLAEAIIPLVERKYRSQASRRVIFGQSLGGQFVLYTAQTKPGLFWGHIASNPALHRNLPLYLEMWPGTPETPTHLFVGSGSNDDPTFREPLLQWIEHWSSQESTPWRLKVETLDGHSHFSAPPASFRAGIAWLFADELPTD